MALLDDVKVACRVTSGMYDGLLSDYIEAARADMRRVGLSEALVDAEDPDPKVKEAIYDFCISRFWLDSDDAARFGELYRQCVTDMLNSDGYNKSAWGKA